MTRFHRALSLVLLSFGIFTSAVTSNQNNPSASQSPLGFWKTEDKKAIVDIYFCANDAKKLCGKITELTTPIDPETGQPKTDKHNTDEKLKDRPLLGLEILSGFVSEDGSQKAWKDGEIYSPTEGKTYDSTMELDGDTLKVRGHVFLFYKTQEWTRVSKPEMN